MNEEAQKKQDYIRWNSKLRADLKLRIQATKLPPRKFLAKQGNVPEGLDDEFLMAILGNYRGNIFKHYHDFLIERCIADCKPDQFVKKKLQYEPIPERLRAKLRGEIERTQVKVRRLLQVNGITDINYKRLKRIVAGQEKGILREVEVVLELYSCCPDAKSPILPRARISEYEDIKLSDLEALEIHIERTGIRPCKLPQKAVEKLKGVIRPYLIQKWLARIGTKCNPEIMAQVLSVYENLPDRELEISLSLPKCAFDLTSKVKEFL